MDSAIPQSSDSQVQAAPTPGAPWWAAAVIYQIYPRSFADLNGDGMGDLPGVTSRLPYLRRLGVDAIWLSPFYLSPQADAGYDVADYRAVDPRFGELRDFDSLLAQAHDMGIRVIVDLVPNHTSDEHIWFEEALAAPVGSPARDRYLFRDGKGAHGEIPPNNWQSIFGGNAWTRLRENGLPGQWYLHLFDTKQPDLNWDNAEVQEEMRSVLRFWLDRGVDGFRVDVAHGLVKEKGLPDWSGQAAMVEGSEAAGHAPHPATPEALNVVDDPTADPPQYRPKPAMDPPSPYLDQDGVHEIYRDWHQVLKEYDGDRMMVAEAWVEPASRLARYVRADEMQQAFNFDFLLAGWDARRMAKAIDESLDAAAGVGAPATWVLSNHDTVRHPSRFGLSDPTTFPKGISSEDEQPDEELGLRRARAATLIMLGLPGSAYLYQGEELGLPEHTTLAAHDRQDPSFFRTNGAERGRDGCRVPLPWRADAPGYGFGGPGYSFPADGVTDPANDAAANNAVQAPWLPQSEAFAEYAVDRQEGLPGSTLEFYRRALALRARLDAGHGLLVWSPLNRPSEGILAYRNRSLLVLANVSDEPIPLPEGYTVELASAAAADGGVLAPNSSVWLLPRIGAAPGPGLRHAVSLGKPGPRSRSNPQENRQLTAGHQVQRPH
ncbi:glycoside hydrolase family 13 protein [Arthrobacter sp. H14-L1]|uniref:glycoside hydrolase family 13 protein n=1 Tax=Arthrobacter sp. H14-L1 TaxID=2996697 RepID=UPI00226E4901|nr:glycoside hydrolase family 13 protein [Arthrobacter sp. H14-L1]MCY0904095.1 glycoside hydrolase family 13 protein [Arthrobacter sp. H14-L1]